MKKPHPVLFHNEIIRMRIFLYQYLFIYSSISSSDPATAPITEMITTTANIETAIPIIGHKNNKKFICLSSEYSFIIIQLFYDKSKTYLLIFLLAVASISLILLSWLTSEAPGS